MSEPRATPDLGTGAKPYITQIEAYETQYNSWSLRGKKIIERYRDVRLGSTNSPLNPLVQRKFNILWSNVETLKPTLYARLPKVLVEREYKDKDPVARVACEIAERAGNYTIKKENLDTVLRACVLDRLLPGRAVAWVDYQVEGQHQPDPLGAGPDGEIKTVFVKTSERAVPRYCDWNNFGHVPVRVWDEVWLSWYQIFLTEDELRKRFPKAYENGALIPLDRKPEDDKNKVDTVLPQATIYVCYDERAKAVVWIHKGVEEILDQQPPSVNFDNFFPWPRPLFASMTNESLQPVPDFYYYQDQADELDKITNRLARVMDAIKVVGVYDKNEAALQRLFHPNGAPDNLLTPVNNWASFVEKGGMKGAFQMAPLEELINTANGMVTQREQILQVIYQITGIADIIRGAGDPNETATAQGIKSQFASLRIKDTQNEVARFSRDIAAMIVECIVENFEPETIWDMTLASTFTDRQTFDAALQMLRNQKLRDFHIDIETDSTINLDDEAEKMAANEFMVAMATFIQQWGPIVQNQPALLPVVSEMMLFLARRYRVGRALEGAIEQALQAMQQQAAQKAQQPQQDPKVMEATAKAQKAQADAQTAQARVPIDAAHVQNEAEKNRISAFEAQTGDANDKTALQIEAFSVSENVKDKRLSTHIDAHKTAHDMVMDRQRPKALQ